MPLHDAKTLVLLPATVVSESGAGGELILDWKFTAATFKVIAASKSGSPTVNVILQEGIKGIGTATVVGQECNGAYVYDDWLALTQLSDNGTRKIRYVGGGAEELASTDGTMTAATLVDGSIPTALKVKYVYGGSGSLTVTVIAELIP